MVCKSWSRGFSRWGSRYAIKRDLGRPAKASTPAKSTTPTNTPTKTSTPTKDSTLTFLLFGFIKNYNSSKILMGTSKVKVEPSPFLLSTEMVPPNTSQ